MSSTVAKIDGDSSGLVTALDKSAKSMTAVKVDAAKLSDQLKEVADDADKAAGALAQKLGGPGAIKAMAGIGVAVGVAKGAVEAFLGSSEALFRSYGEQGQKVWDETEKSLFAVKGAFAAAVLGGGSVEEMGARLQTMFTQVGTVVTTLLTPLGKIADAFYEVAFYQTEATKANNAFVESKNRADKKAAESAAAAAAEADASRNLLKQAGKRAGMAGFADAATVADEANTYRAQIKKELGNASNLIAQQIAKQPRYNPTGFVSAHRMRELNKDMLAEIKLYTDDVKNMAPGFTNLLERFGLGELVPRLAIFAEGARLASNEADQLRVAAGKAQEVANSMTAPPRVAMVGARATVAPAKADEGPPPPAVEEDYYTWVVERENGVLEEISAGRAAEYTAMQEAAGDNSTRHFEILKSELANIEVLRQGAQDAETRILTEGQQNREALEDEARDRKREKDAAAAEAKRAADEAGYNAWVGQNAKQMAIMIGSGKKGSDIARAMVGNVISALGDKAAAEAGIMYAAGNIPGAAAMTAASMGAYAIAAAIGSTVKKSASSSPAAAAPAAPQNISYNLRVDAAFADGELVARQFSRMQREAGRRGFAAVGAY
jgi:hypothetical protein